jgi:c-di-GMP-binding flagellar brake protein YcgR
MNNRRNYERFGSEMVFWVKREQDSDDQYKPFLIEDISAGGIGCDVDMQFQSGDRVVMSFELPQHTDLIEATGVVRHIHRKDGGGFLVGVQFDTVRGVPRQLLEDYLEELFK